MNLQEHTIYNKDKLLRLERDNIVNYRGIKLYHHIEIKEQLNNKPEILKWIFNYHLEKIKEVIALNVVLWAIQPVKMVIIDKYGLCIER